MISAITWDERFLNQSSLTCAFISEFSVNRKCVCFDSWKDVKGISCHIRTWRPAKFNMQKQTLRGINVSPAPDLCVVCAHAQVISTQTSFFPLIRGGFFYLSQTWYVASTGTRIHFKHIFKTSNGQQGQISNATEATTPFPRFPLCWSVKASRCRDALTDGATDRKKKTSRKTTDNLISEEFWSPANLQCHFWTAGGAQIDR